MGWEIQWIFPRLGFLGSFFQPGQLGQRKIARIPAPPDKRALTPIWVFRIEAPILEVSISLPTLERQSWIFKRVGSLVSNPQNDGFAVPSSIENAEFLNGELNDQFCGNSGGFSCWEIPMICPRLGFLGP